MPLESLWLFILAGLLLNFTPGPDVLFVVSNALRGGRRGGIVAALGITAGCFVHIVAATWGVSALMAASSTAFSVLKWMGAAYLVYVGIGLLFQRHAVNWKWQTEVQALPSMRLVFWRGFLTNALNPKVALFFLAFLPQFIGPAVTQKSLAFLLLGLLFTFNGMWVNIGWAWVAAMVASRSQRIQHAMLWLDRIAGLLFLTFGVRLALVDNPTT